MKQFFTFSFFSKKISLLLCLSFILISQQSMAQTTATEDFENETAATSFSEGGINFNHTFTLQNAAPYGFNGSAKFLELINNTLNTNTVSATISINNSLNPSVSFKINSFAGYVAAGGSGTPAFNGQVTVTGTAVGSSTPVSATINIASASGSLPVGQTRDGNGTVDGLNFAGTALAGLYFTSLTFSITDNDRGSVNIGTSYLELDHINFTAQLPSTNQFSINDASITEGSSGTKSMSFTVSCTSTSAASSVQVQSSNGTATAGSDYVALPLTTVNFAAGGATSQTVNVTINGDLTIEPDETFNMTLSNPTGGTIFDGTGVGTILDDDNITETFEDETVPTSTLSTVTSFSERGFNFVSNGDLFVSRGNNLGAGGGSNSTALDTRTGNGASSGNVGSFYINSAGTSFNLNSIDVYTSNNDGASGTTSNVNVTFSGAKADGSGTVSYTATVTPISGDNYQTISFTGTPFANVQILSVSVTLGTGINYVSLDNIRYGTVSFSGIQLSINDVSVLEGTGGGTSTANFTVTRSSNSSAFSVNLASSNVSATAGSDYVAYNSTLNFASGGPLSQNVAVTILRDAIIEGNETFNMTLSGATNGVLYQKPVGIGTILDDDKVVETFEDETNGAATFSENSVTFSAINRFKVLYGSGSNSGSGSSKGYLSSSPSGTSPNTGGSQGKISITLPNTAFKLLQLDGWTGSGTTPSFTAGPVTFTGTLFGGGTVTTTKTITPTNNTGTGWQQNITFTGTPLDNVLLTDLEFIAGGSVTTVEIDNINYVAVATLPVIELTDASNAAIINGAAASATNSTDFGTACTGTPVSKTFTIKNTGAGNLTLSGSPVAVLSGANANQFSITTQPAATVTANSSTTFTVSYSPTAGGTHNAAVTLTSNDGTNNPYVINIKGTATAAPSVTAPTITQPTCTTPTGTIVVNATGASTLEYSINNGTSYQASATFSGLAPNSSNNIRVRYTTGNSCAVTYASNPVAIAAIPTPPTVINPGVTTATNGTAFSQTFTQTGGALPVTFSTASTLPNGLTLSSAGVLSGTPNAVPATYSIIVVATDVNGCTGTGTTYSLVLSGPITFYPKTTSTDLSLTNNWTTDVNGGTGTSPSNFTSANQAFNVNRAGTVLNALTISGGSNLSVTTTNGLVFGPLARFTIGAGSAANFGGNSVTFRSTSAGTASLAAIAGTLTNATNVTIERYIPARRAWRLMTAPLSNTNTIFQAWQNSGINTAGIGTFITSPTPSGSNGLDNGNSNSLKIFDINNQLLLPVNNTNVSLSATGSSAVNQGYFIFVRGDRNPANLILPNSNITTLSSIGSLQTGTQTFATSLTSNTFRLIGNPYASPVDFSLLTRNNIAKRFYTWDPYLNTVGGYVLLDDQDGDGIYSIAPASSQTNILQSTQAFFVQNAGIGPSSLVFNESSKSSVTTNAGFRTGNGSSEVLRTSLYLKNADTAILADGVLSEYNNIFSKEVNIEDGPKFANINESLAIQRDGHDMSLERRPLVDVNDTLFLNLTNTTSRNYSFTFEPSNISSVVSARLEDSYLKTSTPLSVTAPTTVDFSVAAGTASADANRFSVVFKTSGALPISTINVKAYQQNGGIQVDWNVATESNMKGYEVEKSADGQTFTKVVTDAATGNNNAAASYNWFDATPFAGSNFYRIKAVGKSGEISYSQIVNVKVGNGKSDIVVYPNPVHDKVITLQFSNQPKGTYIVQLFNGLGQQLLTKTIEHIGGSATQTIQLGSLVSKGVYQLHVSNGDNKVNQQIIVQ